MDAVKEYKILWDEEALLDLKSIHDYVSKESPEAVAHVIISIVKRTSLLKTFPNGLPYEERLKRYGNFRFLMQWKYKIVFEVMEDEVVIDYIFHSAQHPEKMSTRISSQRKKK